MSRMLPRTCALFAASFLAPLAAAQTTWFVDASAAPPGTGTLSDPYSSIQFALDQSSVVDGDTILVADGVYAESVNFVGKAVIVSGEGPGRPVITGDPAQDVSTVLFRSGEGLGSVLEGVDVTGSVGTEVGGQRYGGGVLIEQSSPVLRDVLVRDSSARLGGGVAVLRGRLRAEECRFEDNSAWQNGGGLYVGGGAAFVTLSDFRRNEARTQSGGGLYGDPNSALFVDQSTFAQNEAGAGAGLFAGGSASLETVTLTGNRILDGWFGSGGGAVLTSGVATDCLVQGNGGFVCLSGAGASGGTWIDSIFRDNYGECFGAGLDSGQARDCLFENNESLAFQGDVPSAPGGGAARSTLRGCIVRGNTANAQGGGTYECNLVDCIVAENRGGWRGWGGGAGVYGGTALRCTIENNVSITSESVVGGGAAFDTDLTQCIVRGNFAEVGAAVLRGTLDRCTVVHNVTSQPGSAAIMNATLTNCIVWGNGQENVDALSTVSYSAIEGGAPGTGNIAVYPGFYGPGSDLHLTAGSPCINAGDPAAAPDPDGSRADMGALAFDLAWVTEGGSFCLADGELVLSAPASTSQPGGSVAAASGGVQVFLLSTTNAASLSSFPGASLYERPAALCLSGRVVRVLASAGSTLPLGPQELATFGLGAGDRLFVQGWFPTSGFSAALDVVVQP